MSDRQPLPSRPTLNIDKVNLGCGTDALPDYLNVDRVDIPGYVDIVQDLDAKEGWKNLGSNFATEIRAFDVFEHVEDPLLFMRECHRILKEDGILRIHTTHWQTENSFTDPTHKRFCTERTFDYWIEGTEYNLRYGPAYAQGRHFEKKLITRDGQELLVILKKLPVRQP